MKTYTAQINEFGNVIVCGDNRPRNSYRIIYEGTYAECIRIKTNDDNESDSVYRLQHRERV